MELSDLKELSELMAVAGELYGKQPSAGLVKVYFSDLKRFPMNAVKAAFEQHRQNPDQGQYFPKPADLIRILDRGASTQGQREIAMEAWNKVNMAIQMHGSYRSVQFEDPLINQVLLEMGGWVNICLSDLDTLPFKAKDFERRYISHMHSGSKGMVTALPGHHEIENRSNGFPERIGEPVRIGSTETREVPRLKQGGTQ